MRVTCQSLQHLVNKWHRKMIFTCSIIEFSVVDAYTPTRNCTSWDQLILLVGYHCHSSLLGYAVNRTDPFTVGYWVNDPCFQQFQNFLLHYLLHSWVQSSLWLHNRLEVLLHKYLVCAYSGTNPFNIRYRPTNCIFILPQNSQQFLFFVLF